MITRLAVRPSPIVVPKPAPPYELDACYRYCEALARARHHNFPVASMFVPTTLRKHIFAIYSFARVADDFADEARFEGQRAAELDRWEDQLEQCYFGEAPDHPVFVALANTIREFELPITEFSSLLQGFRSDLETSRYATFTDLTHHIALTAQPVGRLILYLGGYRDPVLHRYADDLSTALTLARILQDIAADTERDHIYIPAEDLRHFGVSEDDLCQRRSTPAVGALVRYEVARTRALLERARPLVDNVGHDLAIEMALIWLGGAQILKKIDRIGDRLLEDRPHLAAIDKARVVQRALAWRGGSLRARGQRFREAWRNR